jgi:hypothetical protein
MSLLQNALPFVSQLLLVAVLLTLLTGRLVKNSRQHLFIVAVLLLAGLFLPVYGLSFAQWLRSVLGDLSVFSLVIFANILAQRLFAHQLLAQASRNNLLRGIALTGVVFYPFALGVSAFDPYRLGYSPLLLAALLCVASVIAWLRAERGFAMVLLLPLIAFNLQLLESTNLWNYLLDPVVLVYALVQILLLPILARSKVVRSK